MDHEILFRGKRVNNREWATSVCPCGIMCCGTITASFIPDTVGQYTGLTDKNGVKIFEGDIVRFRGKVYTIEYIKKYARFAGTNPGCIFASFLLSASEVIGNIHDNPELLEGGTAS